MDGDRCPGESDCFELTKPGCEDPAETCPDCPKLPTKPGQASEAVQIALMWAMKLDEKINMGRTFSSKDQPSPQKWAALHGLKRGRARFEEWLDRSNKEKQDHEKQNTPPRSLPVLKR